MCAGTLGDAPNFNVGIIDPIVLPGLANCFKVTFRFVSVQGQDLGDASKAVVVTQLVLDDGVVVGLCANTIRARHHINLTKLEPPSC